MSEVNYASGTGVCNKCGQQLLQLEDDGSKLCVVCKSKKLISDGPQVKVAAPTEEQMAKTLAAAGISAGQLIPKVAATPQPVPPLQPVPVPVPVGGFEASVAAALKIMQGLPMPKDVRQFKTIARIIAQMEGLIQQEK